MVRELVLLCSFSSALTFAGSVRFLASLPAGAVSNSVQADAAGNIYLAGSLATQTAANPQDMSDAFVAKISADGTTVLYYTVLHGSSSDSASAIAIASDGSAYVTGTTTSSDFPVTPGAFQTASTPALDGFLVRINPAGSVVYATYIDAPALTQPAGIAVGATGEVFLTGLGGPEYSVSSTLPAQGFLLKFDPGISKVLLSVYGYGGRLITLDGQGNIYLAGNAAPIITSSGFSLPVLPGSGFQTTHEAEICTSSGGPGGGFASYCPYQFIAKLGPAGTLIWSTYVTGTYGAQVAAMAVDSTGNVLVAGTTNSDDYPVTPGAFQTAYTPGAPQLPTQIGPFNFFIPPPNATGFVTKVNATGTGLLWSTYFGGTYQDQITGMAVSSSGEIFLSGRAGSSDLYLAGTPDGCRPTANQVLGFVARLSATSTQLINGAADCLYFGCGNLDQFRLGWPMVLQPTGAAVTAASNGAIASVDFSSTSRVSCIVDPADYAQITSVAPGQLITIFGNDLAPDIPSSSPTLGVYFNGIAAPILYSAAQQINLQVPFEIAGAATVQMQLVSQQVPNPLSETRTLAVVARQPSIFLAPAALLSPYPTLSYCGAATALGQAALALNADGTLNGCTNPATAGSTVTVFLNGFGVQTPALATGATEKTSITLNPGVVPGNFSGSTVAATTTVSGSTSGIAQVNLAGVSQNVALEDATLAAVPLRERLILIWIR